MKYMQVKFLIWEIFKKNQWEFILSLIIIPILWILLRHILVLTSTIQHFPYDRFSLVIIVTVILSLSVLFSHSTISNMGFSDKGFPEHILRLPVPSWLIIAIPVIASITTISLFILIWLNFVLTQNFTWQLQLWICCSATVAISWMHTLMWGFTKSSMQRTIILMVILSLIYVAFQSLYEIDEEISLISKSTAILVLSGLFACGILLAYLAAQRSRQGDPSFDLSFTWLIGLFKNVLPTHAINNFNDPKQAQAWYEWRKYGWIIPSYTMLISGLLLLLASQDKSDTLILTFSSLLFITASFTGFELTTKKFGSGQYQLFPFIETHPISDLDMALSKLSLALKSLVVGFGIILATTLLSLFLTDDKETIRELWIQSINSQGLLNTIVLVILSIMSVFAISWIIVSYCVASTLKGIGLLQLYLISFSFIALTIIIHMVYGWNNILELSINRPHLSFIILMTIMAIVYFKFSQKFSQYFSLVSLNKPLKLITFISALSIFALWQATLPKNLLWFSSYSITLLATWSFLPYLVAPLSLMKNRHR